MAKICPNCGNANADEATFCGSCFSQLDEVEASPIPDVQTAQTYEPVVEQPMPEPVQPAYEATALVTPEIEPQTVAYAQPMQMPVPVQAPAPIQYQPPQSPQQNKSNTGLIVGIVIGAIGLLIAVLVVIFCVVLPSMSQPESSDNTNVNTTEQNIVSEDENQTDEDENQTSGNDETDEKEIQKKPNKEKTKPVPDLPYMDTLSLPKETDFTWIADAQSGEIFGEFIGKDDIVGRWNAEIIFDGSFQLMTLIIDRNGAVSIDPYKINSGSGWEDDDDPDAPYLYDGEFNVGGAGNIVAEGDYGTLDIYQFMESDGIQYGIGTLTSYMGDVANIYLVRE